MKYLKYQSGSSCQRKDRKLSDVIKEIKFLCRRRMKVLQIWNDMRVINDRIKIFV